MNGINFRAIITHWRILVGSGALIATAAALALSAMADAQPTPYFGGGDAGVHSSSAAGIASAPNGSSLASGILVRLTGFVADDTRTVVGVSVEGRNDLGDTVFPVHPTELIDQDGQHYYENGGTADQANRRKKTIYFSPIPATTDHLTLVMDGLEFVVHPDPSITNATDIVRRPVADRWTVSFDVGSPIMASISVDISGGSHSLGATAMIGLDSIRQAPTETVIEGHLSGFSMDEVPEMLLHAQLVGDGAITPTEFIGLRMGFGPDRQQFEVRFPKVSGDVSLHIAVEVSQQPHDARAASTLSEKLGPQAMAVFVLNLPE